MGAVVKAMVAAALERRKMENAFKPFDTSRDHFLLPVESELIGWDEAKQCFLIDKEFVDRCK